MNQPIICFEGPSGIGKTTLGNMLSKSFNIVPEVNLLFERAIIEPKFWYLERQVERYEMCKASNKPSILDGDIFQPIWYNWARNYPPKFLSKKETHEFYRIKLSQGEIAFPDSYIIFQAEEKELWIRKERDQTRQRRNFEKHLKIIEPLKSYYRFLDQETAVEMEFISYTDIDSTKKAVLSSLAKIGKNNIDGVKVLDQIENWFRRSG